MECPYCDLEGIRIRVHKHLMEEHTDVISIDEENALFIYECPECGEVGEAKAGIGSGDHDMMENFDNEIKMIVFDQLLNHLEGKHDY